MRVRIEADRPEELSERGDALLSQLAKALEPTAPQVAAALEGARDSLEAPSKKLRDPVLHALHTRMQREYQATMAAMLGELSVLLDAQAERSGNGEG